VRFVKTTEAAEVAFLCVFLSACVPPLSVPHPTREAEERMAAPSLGGVPHALPDGSYTTIAEVLKLPQIFDGQQVRLRGRVVDVRHSTFRLVDTVGNAVKVVAAEPMRVREGLEVTVAGRLAMRRSTDSSALLEVQNARIVSIAPTRKAPAQPATRLQSKRPPSSPSTRLPVPPPSADQDEGRVF